MQEGVFGRHWTGDGVGLRVGLHVVVGMGHVTEHSEFESQGSKSEVLCVGGGNGLSSVYHLFGGLHCGLFTYKFAD